MKSIFIVTTDAGDGSNYLEWHKTMSDEKIKKLESEDTYGRYASGDGFQCKELKFPEDFDLEAFANANYISWFEDEKVE